MNNVTQVKRGSTASWSLGPELVHWEKLDVWGKDSLIHCEGTDLEMNVYTSSANYFYDENRQLEDVKRPGLWLIKKGEIGWNIADQVIFKCRVEGPSDCWLEVYSSNIPTVHGQKIPLNAGTVEMTVPYLGDWGIYMRWPEQRDTTAVARVKMSIRVKNAYEELAPGQLGIEYTDDGRVKLKAGMPNESKWNKLPYVAGDMINDNVCIDVIKLPATNARQDCIYRLLTSQFVSGALDAALPPPGTSYGHVCQIVNSLLPSGIPVAMTKILNGDINTLMMCYHAYYNLEDNQVYGYLSSDMAEAYNRETGWYLFQDLAPQLATLEGYTGIDYGGIITSIEETNGDPGTLYILLSGELYIFNDQTSVSLDIGRRGLGFGAEIFNSPTNIANGNYSHAEGLQTQANNSCAHAEGNHSTSDGQASHAEGGFARASGDYSHAEGSNTNAIGNASHAEGNATYAEGSHAHAEGLLTQAKGEFSHAEGEFSCSMGESSHTEGGYTQAESPYSHAEGAYVHAVGRSQHVQGEYNIIDTRILPPTPEHDPNGIETQGPLITRPPLYSPEEDSLWNRSKYAHIVGNGSSSEVIYRSGDISLELQDEIRFTGYLPNLSTALQKIINFNQLDPNSTYSISIWYEALIEETILEGDGTTREENPEGWTEVTQTRLATLSSFYDELKAQSFTSPNDITYMYFGNGGLAPYDDTLPEDPQYPFVIFANGDIFLDTTIFNIEDPYRVSIELTRTNELRSNAHTLDWDGNAWFAGNIYVGGIGQSDPKAKRLLTEDDAEGFVEQLGLIDEALNRIIEIQEGLM